MKRYLRSEWGRTRWAPLFLTTCLGLSLAFIVQAASDAPTTYTNLKATGTLEVTGASTLTGNTAVGGTFGATGNATFTTDVIFTAQSVVDGANTACATTCGSATCIFGIDAGAPALLNCAGAAADHCFCIGTP